MTRLVRSGLLVAAVGVSACLIGVQPAAASLPATGIEIEAKSPLPAPG